MALTDVTVTKNINSNIKAVATAVSLNAAVPAPNHSQYDSIGNHNGYEIDVISQFKANLSQVEDLSKKLRFMLNEVSPIIKKS